MEFEARTGYAILGTNKSDDTTWATDRFNTKLYRTTSGNNRGYLIDTGTRHLGYIDELKQVHTVKTVTVIPGAYGSPPTDVSVAMFQFPTKAGHVWFNTNHIYEKFGLKMYKTGAVWFQKKNGF